MKNFLRALSPRTEFGIVIGVAFGYVILISLLRGAGVTPQRHLSAGNLLQLVIFEIVIGTVLISFLMLRGWTPQKIGLQPKLVDLAAGVLLLVTTSILWIATWYLTYFLSPETIAHMRTTYAQMAVASTPIAIVVGTSLINAIFEEVFVAGYVITVLKVAKSPWFAINVSVAIRLLYHLYQGQMAALGVLPLGLVYGWWFARSGRLAPLIVAHAIQDIAALSWHN